jgi:opacity protein-like surface antigen
MTERWSRAALTIFVMVFGAGIAAQGQTDVALNLYGAFSGTTNASSNSGVISPSNAAGGLIEVRHISNPLIGYEATYSFNRANQSDSYEIYTPTACPVGISPCGPTTISASVPANAHEVAGDWVFSLKVLHLRPFALAGAGLLLNVPTSGSATETYTTCGTLNPLCSSGTTSAPTQTQTKAVFVYGAGVDWGLLPHLGLRLQYRGNLYKTPALLSGFPSLSALAHTAEPMIGAYFRF